MEREWKKRENIVLTILLAGYLVFNGILLAGHELWRDEANVWLIARELSPIQLFREIRYQGHPCLWYLLIMPFAKLGFLFKTISVLSFLVMAFGAGIFTFKAPFHPITKFVCLISPIFSYYYPVVARNYCLIALLLILLAYYYPKRNEKPWFYGLLLGLLVQADTIALATAGLISLMWLYEGISQSVRNRQAAPLFNKVKGLWIPFVSLLLWMAEFKNVSDSPEYQFRQLTISEFLQEIRNFSYHILSRMTGQGQAFDTILIVLFLAVGILISIKLKNLWPMIVLVGTFLFQAVFSILVYQLHIWHYIAIAFTLIWFLWLGGSREEGERTVPKRTRCFNFSCRILSEIVLILLSVTMFLRWNSPEESSSLSNALFGLYSDGVNVAAYIRENVNQEELILSTDVAESSTVQAYLGKDYTFYYAGNGKKVTYADYAEEQKQVISYDEMIVWAKANFPEKEDFYILESPSNCIKNIPDEAKAVFQVCYRTEGETARGENYTLYRVAIK
ncbi:MAG: hypothetical protein MR992_01910 [Lachnospiraceae bacterium]|nr:hypothetical protein [Lachnospiraceae bacterium]MDD7628455.1 hypothetical protein [Lachnospiraceae bacterium]MDY4119981.1 hypothetical protein [Lachnospiraceae bacterium]